MGKRIGTLGLVNYVDHPRDKNYKVFNFNTKKEADLFEQYLSEAGVWFDKDEEAHKDAIMYLFAIEQKDFNRAQNANFKVSATYRKPMIPSAILRYALVIFFFALIALAVIGYVKN